jgi:hypothetical protein
MPTLIVFWRYRRFRCAARECLGVGLKHNFNKVDSVNARSSQVPSIAYIEEPIACWYLSRLLPRACSQVGLLLIGC